MPVIGSFHAKFWKARANAALPPGAAVSWIYPQVQSVIIMSTAIWCLPLDILGPVWAQLRWFWMLARRLWSWRHVAQQDALERWLGRIETMTPEQLAVCERVAVVVDGPFWELARAEVRACAMSPKFHQPEHWVSYSRIVKSNAGQAQNIWRHMRVVQAMQSSDASLSNPEAHLLAELAYQGLAVMGRPGRVLVHHATLH